MDQNSSNGTDKRNWRERLGIGAGKDMPRIADEFSAAPTAAKAAVKPAPMAPRPGVKAAPPRAMAPAPAPEKLAEKLKAQRDAQERLAEQRVQAARQRAEVKPDAQNGSKPKFSFAVEEAEAAARATLPVPPMPQPRPQPAPQMQAPPVAAKPQVPQRSMVPPPAINPPPLTPPRQPLGGERPMMPTRPSAAPPPVVPTRPQQRYSPPPSTGYSPQPGYGAQVPSYRPIEPSSRSYGAGGYVPPPAYVPPATSYNNQPRLSVPPAMPQGGNYGSDGYETRARNLRPPARPSVGYRDDYAESDVFTDPRAQRRATANEYSQAYRDEQGYEDELPPSRGPWVPLALLLLLAVLAGAGLYYVWNSANKQGTTAQSGNTPVVEAPAQPAKVTPDPAQPLQGQPTKKLIYDRIVGDREVLGGDVIQSEEVPAQPGDSTNLQGNDPAVQGGIGDPAQPTGQEDLVPLPLPPPPGENGSGDQQGAAPSNKTSNEAMIQPAAGESQAAVPSQDATQKSDPEVSSVVAISETPAPAPAPTQDAAPVPGETDAAAAATGGETISDTSPVPEAPTPKKKVAESTAKAKKPVVKKVQKSLGAKPVVLVPPADGAEPALDDQQVASIDDGAAVGSSGGGLYDGDVVVAPGINPAPAPAPVKKKKTLADLFRGESTDDAPDVGAGLQQESDAVPVPAPVKKVQTVPAPAPQPQQQASAGGYVVQLASFPNQSDASKEYGRLKGKHGATLSGLSPIVSQAVVGGSTRYRLAVGVMPSREQASAVCAKLFAAGERDCLVRRQ